MKYIIKNKITGAIIDSFRNKTEAQITIKGYEIRDIRNKCFKENTYEIIIEDK